MRPELTYSFKDLCDKGRHPHLMHESTCILGLHGIICHWDSRVLVGVCYRISRRRGGCKGLKQGYCREYEIQHFGFLSSCVSPSERTGIKLLLLV